MINFFSKFFLFLGIFFIFLGIFTHLIFKTFRLGKLPGDILIKKENFVFYFPLGTCLLLSLILTFLFWIIKKIR